ncbi:restriction endonuclease subunit S [Halopseudomonas aestusnigri]|uniref:restriction endonuclease subunit S n=1 Tax=Halopseudomonas aestusnigri TaxID=857252 RepID=UPI0028C33DAB|nr:restriction endonuclease subunit S [Halopseudomonas aestusnigri]
MTALLTDNLPLLAGAPNGIKKLRELILEQAVRGKLVPQDPNDEPASELLERIAEEKARLVAGGKIKKQKPLAQIDEEETPFELPINWTWSRLGNLVIESGAGWSPSCEPRPRKANEWGVLKVSAVSWGIYQPEENKALPASLEARPEHEVAEGDFLVSRANTAELVARSVVVETTPAHLMLSDKIVRLKLTTLCERHYANLANSSPLARYYYSRVAGGTSSSMKNVSREQILSLPLALPPLAEQHRIVAKVDELMALCDRLEAQQADADSAHAQLVQALLNSLTQASDADDFAQSWQRLAEHFHTLFTTESSIDALKQTLLQLAVMGKLVPQDPSDEPAGEDLVKELAHQRNELRRSGRIRESKEAIDFSGLDEMKICIPPNWNWVRMSEIAEVVRGGSPRPAGDPQFYGGDIPFLKVADITAIKGKYLEGYSSTIKEAGLKKTRYIDAQTVLLTNSGATLGVPGICNFPASFNDGVAAFIEKSDLVFDEYLYLYLKTLTKWFLTIASRGQGQPNLNTDIIKSTWFALPPLAEQHRIVAKVDQLMALCDQLKSCLTQARQLHEQLASTLVEQAVA